jgi:hypothetical protein
MRRTGGHRIKMSFRSSTGEAHVFYKLGAGVSRKSLINAVLAESGHRL